MRKVFDKQTKRNIPSVTTHLPNEGSHRSIKASLISLPYKGKQGKKVIRSLRNTLDKIQPQDVEPKFIYAVMQEKQKDFKIGLMNIREKIVSLLTKKITKMCPETISKFLEMDGRR